MGLWLRERKLWPGDEPLPAAVRWLARDQLPKGHEARSDSTAAGALVLAMRSLAEVGSSDPPGKVHLVTIDARGRKAQHWQGKRGDKRTYGTDTSTYGLLTHWPVCGRHPYDLHFVEGLADGLAVLSGLPYEEQARQFGAPPMTGWQWAKAGFVAVAVCAGKSYRGVEPGWFGSVTLWPDGDDPKALSEAREQAQQWVNQGYHHIQIERLPDGYDPAAIRERGTIR